MGSHPIYCKTGGDTVTGTCLPAHVRVKDQLSISTPRNSGTEDLRTDACQNTPLHFPYQDIGYERLSGHGFLSEESLALHTASGGWIRNGGLLRVFAVSSSLSGACVAC